MPMSQTETITIALEVGAWLQHLDDRILDGNPLDKVWAAERFMGIVEHETNPAVIGRTIAAQWYEVRQW